jgi:hypothetical protein
MPCLGRPFAKFAAMQHTIGSGALAATALVMTVGCSTASGAGGVADAAMVPPSDSAGGPDDASNVDGESPSDATSLSESGGEDAVASGDVSPGDHPFACGDLRCDSGSQYCSIVSGHLPGMAASYQCSSFEGGRPSCGSSSAMSQGQCGCYESDAGEVTSTLCPP